MNDEMKFIELLDIDDYNTKPEFSGELKDLKGTVEVSVKSYYEMFANGKRQVRVLNFEDTAKLIFEEFNKVKKAREKNTVNVEFLEARLNALFKTHLMHYEIYRDEALSYEQILETLKQVRNIAPLFPFTALEQVQLENGVLKTIEFSIYDKKIQTIQLTKDSRAIAYVSRDNNKLIVK